MTTAFDFSAQTLNGETVDLARFRGQVLLIVNTASQCGFTPQYAGLQALHEKYASQGLVVLGFPCNQFARQEPGDAAEIGAFCERNYGVSFTMFDKIEVIGDGTHPLYSFLKASAPGLLGTEGIKWNFTKFLVGRDGQVLDRYAPTTKPEAMQQDIEKALQASV
ncbi:glutathione peroxidase [Leeia aquatica]|uniref:Glutathione peroxidase n=1 Tax=Leeia aquatica TaxID=2725557 RepID=A0A847SJW8_9NEIS|nr:glutathione peroxidase [Leeia aquatica]NLR76212.1 glutathione peroxidase [Leeia aquatica]